VDNIIVFSIQYMCNKKPFSHQEITRTLCTSLGYTSTRRSRRVRGEQRWSWPAPHCFSCFCVRWSSLTPDLKTVSVLATKNIYYILARDDVLYSIVPVSIYDGTYWVFIYVIGGTLEKIYQPLEIGFNLSYTQLLYISKHLYYNPSIINRRHARG